MKKQKKQKPDFSKPKPVKAEVESEESQNEEPAVEQKAEEKSSKDDYLQPESGRRRADRNHSWMFPGFYSLC